MKTRSDVIQFIIDTFGYKSYLEVGVQFKDNWNKISCAKKVGVEPNNLNDANIHPMTSDTFFAGNKDKFDLIFIDGNHNYAQVIKDYRNALRFLNKGGRIIFHDALPYCKESTDEFNCGTVFKALLEARSENAYDFCTWEEDHGVCVITPSVNAPTIDCKGLEWEEFYPRRIELFNVKNAEDFKKHFTK